VGQKAVEIKSESVRVSEPTSAGSDGLSNLQLATMAIAAAATASNLYYCQPLLSQIAGSLHMTARETADIPMLTQVGYALGLLFLAPLGDMVERRGLATALLLIVTVSLLGTSFAPDAWVLMATSLMSGMFSVVPQVHYGAQMVEPLRFCRMATSLSSRKPRSGAAWDPAIRVASARLRLSPSRSRDPAAPLPSSGVSHELYMRLRHGYMERRRN
jgi:hypothetical protein